MMNEPMTHAFKEPRHLFGDNHRRTAAKTPRASKNSFKSDTGFSLTKISLNFDKIGVQMVSKLIIKLLNDF